jgi:hypothetical protein
MRSAQEAVDVAQKRRDDARIHEGLLQERAEKAHEDIEKSNPGESIAKDIDNRKSEAVAAVVEAEANLRLAEQDKQDAHQCPALGPEQLQEKEALCLRQDVNDVMRKVEAHKAAMDPDDIVKRLQDVRPPTTKDRRNDQ